MGDLEVKYQILILCDFNRKSANTIIDHVTSFKRYSEHDVFYINPVGRNKPSWLNLNEFDAIIIHYSIYILGDNYINSSWRKAIALSPATKVQFIQDEYRTVNEIHDRLRTLKINILYTCFPEEEIEKVYPTKAFPGTRKINNLTGYVSEYFESKRPDFHKRRSTDVGYRGRGEGLWWLGGLYQEKSFIGREFLRYAQEAGLRCDISSKEEDRIYGRKWIRFLQNCRCTLGTESGASVIDFTGEVEENVKRYCRSHPRATFEDVRNLFFKDLEGKIRMNQISPRAFEAIGCGCCQILFEGEYSKILKPDIHYIPLKKDFSNISEVLEKIKDDSLVEQIAQQAYEDIVANGRYSYRTFIEGVERQIEEFVTSCGFKKQTVSFSGSQSTMEQDVQESNSDLIQIFKNKISLAMRVGKFFVKTMAICIWRFIFLPFLRWSKRIYLLHPFFLKERIKLMLHILKNIEHKREMVFRQRNR